MSKVRLYVYDLSMGMARQLSPGLLGREIPGIYHTGIAVFNREFFFGGGIQETNEPNPMWTNQPAMQHQIIDLGETNKTPAEFRTFLGTISHRFTQATYDLLNHNCNNFTDECSKFLLDHGIPGHITGLPQEVLSTPIGAMLRPMIDQFQQQMTGAGASLDPFAAQQSAGNTLGAPPTAPVNPWQDIPAPAADPEPELVTRHRGLTDLRFRKEYNRPLLSSDANQSAVLDRVIAASAKLPAGQQLSESDIALLKRSIGSDDPNEQEAAMNILCGAYEQWPASSMGSLLWLLRWWVTKETGNLVVATRPGMLTSLVARIREMSATARMMGLAMLANMCAHDAGKQALTTPEMQDLIVDSCLQCMDSAEPLERRVCTAVLYNLALQLSTSMTELISVQLVCGLFPLINGEADEETQSRLLAALAHTLYCNPSGCEAAANFGFELQPIQDGQREEIAKEIRSLYL